MEKIDEKFVEKQLMLARMGKENWDTFIEEVKADHYFILPHEGDEFNILTAKYMQAYMERNHYSLVAIIASDINDLAQFNGENGIICIKKDVEWIDSILKYYSLVFFNEHLTIVSLTKPYDTCGMNLLGVHGVTKTELLCYDILCLDEIPKI